MFRGKSTKFSDMEKDFFRVQSVLCDLQKFASKENEILSLTTLNKIISSSQEEIEVLYNSNGIDVIMSLFESDTKLANICLKILTKTAKRNEKVRRKLLKNNIFCLLSLKLKSETDFNNNNLILYSVLIVVLLKGNYEAQDQMRTSGCLSAMVYILSCILDETDIKPLSSKVTELIIYTLISSNKEPQNRENQTEIGWIIPKVLEYLEEQTIFMGNDGNHKIKCFWFFLKTVTEKNELNQQIFLNSCGLGVLFRSIQDIVEGENCDEMAVMLVKLTGVLTKFKSNKEFLYQTCNFCPIMILCSALKSSDSLVSKKTCQESIRDLLSLLKTIHQRQLFQVLQNIVLFLDRLTREYPQVVEMMSSIDILGKVRKVKEILTKGNTEFCSRFWNRIETFEETRKTYKIANRQLGFSNNFNSQQFPPKLQFIQTHFCVVHDNQLIKYSEADSQQLSHSYSSVKAIESKRRDVSFNKVKLSVENLSFNRKEFRNREKKLRKIIAENFSCSLQKSENRFGVLGTASKRILQVFQKLLFFFKGIQSDDLHRYVSQ